MLDFALEKSIGLVRTNTYSPSTMRYFRTPIHFSIALFPASVMDIRETFPYFDLRKVLNVADVEISRIYRLQNASLKTRKCS